MTKTFGIWLLSLFTALFLANTNSALSEELPLTSDSRIKTLVYNANEVYELKFYYGYQSFIEFSDDEDIQMISMGEAFAWRLTTSGKRLFIRPLEIAAHTNMIVITSKRTYQFDIRSGEYDGRADEELVYTVRFYYPEAKKKASIEKMDAATAQLATMPLRVDQNLPVQPGGLKLNFNYSFAGKATELAPLKVYDDNRETYFQFKNNNAIIPLISSVDQFGNETPLSYRLKTNYLAIPVISAQFTLRLGDRLLCVFNNKLATKPSAKNHP